MDGYEHPARTKSSDDVYRLSWLAYVNATVMLLVLVSASAWIGWWALYKAQTDQTLQIGMVGSIVLLVAAVGMYVYNFLYLKSVYLYTDNVGVWLYRGILPWSRGYRGVKWRDIEDAMYFTGFSSWVFRSYSVRIGHRFTKTSEISVTHLARGNKAVEHINQMHQNILKTEHTDEI